jgi:hypothetical protein
MTNICFATWHTFFPNMSILTYKPPKANASDNTLFNTNLGESRSLEHGIGMLNKKFQTLKKLDVHI